MRDITLGDTFRHHFTTRAFATGIPTVLAGTPVLSVLEENNATPITAGVSISVDRASVVGLNEATIIATSGNGYELGKSYSIYISTGDVGGVSVVGEVVGHFTIAASAAAVDLANVTDGLGAIKAETALIVADTNELQSDDVPTLIAAVQSDTDDIQTRLPAALVGSRMDSSVGAMATNVLTASAIAAAALNGKGDWNIGKTGYSLTQTFPTNFADLAITLTTGRVDINVNNDKTGYSLGTGGFPIDGYAASAITAAALALDAGQEIADRIIARNIEGGSDTGRTIGETFARLRNRVRNNAGTLEVYDITDASILWSGAITTSAVADPITEVDPT